MLVLAEDRAARVLSPNGGTVERALDRAEVNATPSVAVNWPVPEPAWWTTALAGALTADLAQDLETVRQRQAGFLRRELERQRRREDQIRRHEIRVIPHLDGLLMLAEPAWRARVSFAKDSPGVEKALYVPRTRLWIREPGNVMPQR